MQTPNAFPPAVLSSLRLRKEASTTQPRDELLSSGPCSHAKLIETALDELITQSKRPTPSPKKKSGRRWGRAEEGMTATGSRGARPNEDTARLWDLARGRVHRPCGTRTERERWAQEVGSPPPAAWKPTVEAHALHQASAPGVQARLRSPPGTSSSNPVAPPRRPATSCLYTN